MFAFSYLLMNRAVDRWFSQPVTQMREDANNMAVELFRYAAANARSEADSIAIQLADSPVGSGIARIARSARRGQPRLRTTSSRCKAASSVVYRDGQPSPRCTSRAAPPARPRSRACNLPTPPPTRTPTNLPPSSRPRSQGPVEQAILQAAQRNDDPFYTLGDTDYTLATAGLKHGGLVVVGLPIPAGISATSLRLRKSADAYWTLFRERRQIRCLYMLYLLLITGLALFACCWLALNLSKQVTRPWSPSPTPWRPSPPATTRTASARSATEELGELVASFNAMAADLESAAHRRRALHQPALRGQRRAAATPHRARNHHRDHPQRRRHARPPSAAHRARQPRLLGDDRPRRPAAVRRPRPRRCPSRRDRRVARPPAAPRASHGLGLRGDADALAAQAAPSLRHRRPTRRRGAPTASPSATSWCSKTPPSSSARRSRAHGKRSPAASRTRSRTRSLPSRSTPNSSSATSTRLAPLLAERGVELTLAGRHPALSTGHLLLRRDDALPRRPVLRARRVPQRAASPRRPQHHRRKLARPLRRPARQHPRLP